MLIRLHRKTLATAVLLAISVPAAAVPFTSTNRNVLVSNTGTWSAAGVSLGGTTFIVRGLEGVGRVAASSTQTIGGVTETLGSISDLQISNWARNATAGNYRGTFNVLPDRGYNAGTVFSNYAARINTFDFTFTPYTAAAPTTDQNQIQLTYTGATRFTYDHDHDNNAATQPVLTTGLVANSAAITLFGKPVPTVAANSIIGTDGPLANRLTLDSEGLILDPRPGKEGEGWVGDEYGAYIYHFNAAKQIDGIVSIPEALVPHKGGATYFTDTTNTDGRRINQGMEGITISPDGTRLIAMLQSATIQDSGSGNQGRTNTRVVVYDIAGGKEVPTDPIEQYVLQLPRIDSNLDGSVDRAGAQSSILALSNSQILVLSRDGNGRGADGAAAPVFKSVLLADFATASNIDGLYDAAGNKVVSSGDTLLGSITPVPWTEALNILGKLDLGITELEQFGLNLTADNTSDINSLSEKWEGMALVSALDPLKPNDYFLFLGNDNDFQTANGTLTQANGAALSYDAGRENDTMLLAFRVTVVPGPSVPAPSAFALLALGLVGMCLRRRNLR